METKSNKTIVLETYRKIIRDLDLTLVDTYVKEDYIQHSPTVKNGREGILEMLHFLKTLPKPAEQGPSPIIRAIADGDLVAVHLDIKFMGKRMAVIDLFRLENGQLAEHWDASQVQPERQDGTITMTNGTTSIDETCDTMASKRLIRNFYADVFEEGNTDAAGKYFMPGYVEHDLVNDLLLKRDYTVKVHRIIGEGNFVVAQCEFKSPEKALAHYGIFRVEGDKMAEHWSVEQEVPALMAHGNGMF